MVKITNLLTRNNLSEGRNSGIGFGFAKKKGKVYEMQYPISPCKDYLNDVVFTEATGLEVNAYGCHSKPNRLFDDKNGYLTFRVCTRNKNDSLSDMTDELKKLSENLSQNLDNLLNFINSVEGELAVDGRSVFHKTDIEGVYLAVVPKQWLLYNYSVSLYSWLIRIGVNYTNEYSPIDFIMNYKHDQSEQGILMAAKPNLAKIFENKLLPKQNLVALMYHPEDFDYDEEEEEYGNSDIQNEEQEVIDKKGEIQGTNIHNVGICSSILIF